MHKSPKQCCCYQSDHCTQYSIYYAVVYKTLYNTIFCFNKHSVRKIDSRVSEPLIMLCQRFHGLTYPPVYPLPSEPFPPAEVSTLWQFNLPAGVMRVSSKLQLWRSAGCCPPLAGVCPRVALPLGKQLPHLWVGTAHTCSSHMYFSFACYRHHVLISCEMRYRTCTYI